MGRVRTLVPKLNVQSLPKDTAKKIMSKNGKILVPTSFGVPLPTSTTKVGEGLGMSGGYPIARQSTTPHPRLGTTVPKSMGAFPTMRPPTSSQTQQKLRPSNLDKYDVSKDPHNHMANIRQVIRAKHVNEWHTQFEGFRMTLDEPTLDWFRDIPKNAYKNLEDMEKEFIEAFFLTRVTKIYNFKQTKIRIGGAILKG